MEQQDFNALFAEANGAAPQEGQPQVASAVPPGAIAQQQPQAPEDPNAAPNAQVVDGSADGSGVSGEVYDQGAPGIVPKAILAVGVGAHRAAYETKDFFLGPPAKSTTDLITGGEPTQRGQIDAIGSKLTEDSWGYGLTAGIAQFATGMAGLGKVTGALGLLKGTAGGVIKAATVGAVAFDPHQERLSNLLVNSELPGLDNFATRFLQSKPEDSAALGRTKAALESIGLDLTLIGAFAGGLKVAKLVKGGGSKEAISEAADAVAKDAAKLDAEGAGPGAAEPPSKPSGQTEPVAGEASPAQGAATAEGGQAVAAPVSRDVLDVSAPKRDVINVQQVKNPTDAAAQAGEPKLPAQGKGMDIPDETLDSIFRGVAHDAEALDRTDGNWVAAIEAGHTFGRGGKIPWQKVAGEGFGNDGADAFTARVAEMLQPEYSKIKGGEVLSDRRVTQMVNLRARMWNENPADLLGILQQAGKEAPQMVANMEAGFLVAHKAMQDAFTLSAQIRAGYLADFGGDLAAAGEALKAQTKVAAQAFGAAQSIKSNMGRGMRRMRTEFGITAEQLAHIDSMEPGQLAVLLSNTAGNPRVLAKALNPSFLATIRDGASFLYANNLLWGWKTQFVNTTTNTYMLLARPLERIIGGAGRKVAETAGLADSSLEGGLSQADAIMIAGYKQYAYMGTALRDSFNAAIQTFKSADSVLTPHSLAGAEAGGARDIGGQIAAMQFKPWDSLSNVGWNAMAAGLKTFGAPVRVLGTADELMKQITYRSKVMTDAHIEGIKNGLDGPALNQYVKDTLLESFDDAGRAVNAQALHEAQTATFQQDLLPGTLGKGVQNFVNGYPLSRFVLPFVKTPTNVVRYGIKLTPGLNIAQAEYRAMLTGAKGAEAQSQAIGQMAMGSMFLGIAGMAALEGRITGGGPADPKLLKQLKDTGWQPYSFVLHHDDGSQTYIPYSRFDPIAVPFGIVADMSTVIQYASSDDNDSFNKAFGSAGTALLVAMGKQLGNKTYLQSMKQAVDFLSDPDKNAGKFAGQTIANMIPMSSMLRQINDIGFDSNMRDARGVTDNIMQSLPGYSQGVPARYDAFGDAVLKAPGLWVRTRADRVDAEMRRMTDVADLSVGPPSPSVGGVDLRDVTMVDGTNAYEKYQQLAGHPKGNKSLKDTIGEIIDSNAYQHVLVDGDPQAKGTKQGVLLDAFHKFHSGALKQIKADKNVREALFAEQQRVTTALAAQRAGEAEPSKSGAAKTLGNIMRNFGIDVGPALNSIPGDTSSGTPQ